MRPLSFFSLFFGLYGCTLPKDFDGIPPEGFKAAGPRLQDIWS